MYTIVMFVSLISTRIPVYSVIVAHFGQSLLFFSFPQCAHIVLGEDKEMARQQSS